MTLPDGCLLMLTRRTNRRKPGRPPRAGKVSSARLEIRLTGVEYERWSTAAERQNLTLSDWVREACELAWVRGSTR